MERHEDAFMDNLYESTYLPDILHDIAQGLLVPTMVVVVALIVVSLFFIGQIIVEAFTERSHYKQNMPGIVNRINDANYADITSIIQESGLLRLQKAALITVSRNMGLPEDPLFALAQIQINKAELHYKRRVAWSDVVSKIGPMLGLMGTLIPLGPGIVALGQGDTVTLAKSLNIAFDATVCGLVCAVLALIISKVRAGWYGEYIETLESLMTCVLDKAASARADGVSLPTNYDGDPLRELAGKASTSYGSQGVSATLAVSSASVAADASARSGASVATARSGALGVSGASARSGALDASGGSASSTMEG